MRFHAHALFDCCADKGREKLSTFHELLEKLSLKGHREEEERVGFSERMKKLFRMKEKFEAVPEKEVLSEILQSDMENIRGTLEEIDKDAFAMAAELIQNARKIYICGIRSCEPLADFLGFYLNMMFEEVHVVRTNSASEIFEQLMRIGSEDVLIGISFPRYSMRTLKAMELANNRSARVISITDSIHSPLNLYSSCNLICKSEMASVVDSLTAPLSVINALIVALCLKNQETLKESIETLEDLCDDYQIYGRDEMESSDGEIEIYHQGSKVGE